MASAKPKGGLTKWFNEEWVDIGRKKKSGGHAPCGRKKASTKKKGQGVGGKPTRVRTMAKKNSKKK